MGFFPPVDCYLLHGHLGHQIKGGEVCTGKAVFVLAHLDGVQPLIHRSEAGEIRDAAVQEGEMNATGDKDKDAEVTSSSKHICSPQRFQTEPTPTRLIHQPSLSKRAPQKKPPHEADTCSERSWESWPQHHHSTARSISKPWCLHVQRIHFENSQLF